MKTIEIVNWQDQGFYGLLWSPDGRSAETVPHPNLRCPEELFASSELARAACESRIEQQSTNES